jgi:hypothetical protein
MPDTVVLALLIGVALVGLLRIAGRLVQWKRKKAFAEDYLARFQQCVREEPFDEERYRWLVQHGERMQRQLGRFGYTARPATPYEPMPVADQAVLLGTLPELRAGNARSGAVAACEEALVRHLARLGEARADFGKQFINPVVWLGEGVGFVLLLPLLVLQWLGLLKAPSVARIARSTAFGVFSGLIALLGLVAAVLILTLGWGWFTDMLDGLLDPGSWLPASE